jgi:hypothetical protein
MSGKKGVDYPSNIEFDESTMSLEVIEDGGDLIERLEWV